MTYAWIMVIHVQIWVLSDFITLGNRELLFRSHNAIYLRREQPVRLVRLDRQAAFKYSTVWYVRAGKGLSCDPPLSISLPFLGMFRIQP